MVVAFAIATLALVGSKFQDAKKREQMGEAWQQWESQTSYWPRLSRFATAGALPWLAGIGLFLLFSWLHQPLGAIPAGVWRWF